MGLIVFGVHLTFLALLAFKSGFVPVPLSILLVIAGPAFTIIHLLYNLGPEERNKAISICPVARLDSNADRTIF